MRVFISYSHADKEPWLERLLIHLKPLTIKPGIEVWSDKEISIGEKWFPKIEEALLNSQVSILLISADFLASDFINKEELPRILQSSQEHGSSVIPIITSPCNFSAHNELLKFQAVNLSTPLVNITRGEQESIFQQVAQRVESIANTHEISQVKNRVIEQKQIITEQQDIINKLVIFSMSFHIYNILKGFCNNEYPEFIYRSSEHKDIIQFLRDNGFIEMVYMRQLQELENLVGKIKPTPIGRFYVEQREKFEKA